MHNNHQFESDQIPAVNTRQIAVAVLCTIIISAVIALIIIRHNHHKLDIYSAETAPLNKSLVIKSKTVASAATGYAPVSMSFNLPSAGH